MKYTDQYFHSLLIDLELAQMGVALPFVALLIEPRKMSAQKQAHALPPSLWPFFLLNRKRGNRCNYREGVSASKTLLVANCWPSQLVGVLQHVMLNNPQGQL
jgi:hypothetical protein